MSAADELLAGLETRRLADAYAAAVDAGDNDGFAGLFTPDGMLEAPRGKFEGRAAISGVPAMMKGLYRGTWHGVLGQVVRFDGDRAEGETRCIARHFYDAPDGDPHCYEMTIRYADSFARIDGRWLIARRVLHTDAGHRFPLVKPTQPATKTGA